MTNPAIRGIDRSDDDEGVWNVMAVVLLSTLGFAVFQSIARRIRR